MLDTPPKPDPSVLFAFNKFIVRRGSPDRPASGGDISCQEIEQYFTCYNKE
jgi:hypothetical protein